MLVLNVIGLKPMVRMPSAADTVGSLAVAIFLGSFSLPPNFKSGSIKMRYVNMVLFMLMFFLPGFLVGYLRTHFGDQVIQTFIVEMAKIPDWLQASAITALLLATLLISLAVSLKIYANKEF